MRQNMCEYCGDDTVPCHHTSDSRKVLCPTCQDRYEVEVVGRGLSYDPVVEDKP